MTDITDFIILIIFFPVERDQTFSGKVGVEHTSLSISLVEAINTVE